MPETFWSKWRHRLQGAWLVLTGRAWVGHGNPTDWQPFAAPKPQALIKPRTSGQSGVPRFGGCDDDG